MKHFKVGYWAAAVLLGICSTVLVSCASTKASDDSADGGLAPDPQGRSPGGSLDLGTRPPAAPKFVFEAKPPGRAAGLRATVLVGGTILDTNELEVQLDAEQAPTQKSLSQPKQDMATPGNGLGRTPAVPRAEQAPPVTRQTLLGVDKPADFDSVDDALSFCPARGDLVERMGTVNGAVCYAVATVSAESLGFQQAYYLTIIFAREGIYRVRSIGNYLAVPPSWVTAAHSWGFGCVPANEPGYVTAKYFNALLSFTINANILFYSAGITFYRHRELGMARIVQFDEGVSYGFPVLTAYAALPVNLGMAIQEDSDSRGPNLVFPWHKDCVSAATEDNLLEYASGAASDLDMREDPLAGVVLDGFSPLLNALGSPGVGGVGPHVPAATNADLFADQLHAAEASASGSAPDTSADGLIRFMEEHFDAATDDPASLLAAGTQVRTQADAVVPSRAELARLLQNAEKSMFAADELVNAALDSRTTRFVNPAVIDVPTASGTEAEITITPQEVAELIGRPIEDVIGATVLVNAGPDIIDAEFELGENGLVLTLNPTNTDMLLRFDVNLATASGSFPDDVSEWLVRPAMRLVKIVAGDPAAAIITGPQHIVAGGPASLSVQVVDANGKLVEQDFDVVFTDAEGGMVGMATSERGTANLQFVPSASSPHLESVNAAELQVGGEPTAGFELHGTGFSLDATVELDGRVLDTEEYLVKSSGLVLVVPNTALLPGEHVFQVINPPDFPSETASVSTL